MVVFGRCAVNVGGKGLELVQLKTKYREPIKKET